MDHRDVQRTYLVAHRAKRSKRPDTERLYREARTVGAVYWIEKALAPLDDEQRADALERVRQSA